MYGKLLNGQPVLSTGCGKKVLVLGTGRVSKPAVDYLLDQDNIEVTTADFYIDAAKAAAADRDRARAVAVDARNREDLAKLVKGHDAVICLVHGVDVNLTKIVIAMAEPKPAIFTTDYVKPGLEALMQQAVNSNTYVMTGVGTDPGIDHAALVQMKNNLEKTGGKIKELYSLCGSLPAKENSNSWGMRLGWLPTGIVDSITSTPLPNGNPGSITGSDILVHLMLRHPDWNYREGQQDIVVMKHIMVAQYPGGVKKELTSAMVLKGDPFLGKVFVEENHRQERFGMKVQVFPDGRRGVYLSGASAISWSVGAAAAAAVVGCLTGETHVTPGIKYGPLTDSTSRSLLKRLDDIGICLVHDEKMYNENNPPLKRIKSPVVG